jgi:hypothetical protein
LLGEVEFASCDQMFRAEGDFAGKIGLAVGHVGLGQFHGGFRGIASGGKLAAIEFGEKLSFVDGVSNAYVKMGYNSGHRGTDIHLRASFGFDDAGGFDFRTQAAASDTNHFGAIGTGGAWWAPYSFSHCQGSRDCPDYDACNDDLLHAAPSLRAFSFGGGVIRVVS